MHQNTLLVLHNTQVSRLSYKSAFQGSPIGCRPLVMHMELVSLTGMRVSVYSLLSLCAAHPPCSTRSHSHSLSVLPWTLNSSPQCPILYGAVFCYQNNKTFTFTPRTVWLDLQLIVIHLCVPYKSGDNLDPVERWCHWQHGKAWYGMVRDWVLESPLIGILSNVLPNLMLSASWDKHQQIKYTQKPIFGVVQRSGIFGVVPLQKMLQHIECNKTHE